jgi:hypothetical protein
MPQAPSQTEFVMGVAQEMLDEYVPDPNQRRILIGILILPLLLLLINWFANIVAKRVAKELQAGND